jgi:hypothetical protein
MKTEKIDAFLHFVDSEILPAAAELDGLPDKSRRHLQKLAYTNLVDLFDSMVDGALLDNCRESSLVSAALRNLTQQVTEADLVKMLLVGEKLQDALEEKLRDGLRATVLRERHSLKLRILCELFSPGEDYLHKPRVNVTVGDIYERIKPHKRQIPHSICGYADWLYSRRNAIVHGGGAARLNERDAKQIKKIFNCIPAMDVHIKPASVRIAARFYRSVAALLNPSQIATAPSGAKRKKKKSNLTTHPMTQ